MAVIVYKQFSGEIPNAEAHLLPPDRAQLAKNCEFTGGSLQSMKGGFLLQTMLSNPVRGIYTEDGINFYTWSAETQAFKSPVIDDSYSRVYHLTPALGKFNVSTTLQAAYNGPSPSAGNIWKAGVPQPAAEPVLALVDRSTLADYPSAYAKIEAWYEYGGKQYGRTEVSASGAPFRSYTFAQSAFVAEKTTTTQTTDESGNVVETTTTTPGYPSGATLSAKVSFLDGANSGAEIASATARTGTNGRSTALPGGFEASISTNGTAATVSITWGVVETRAYIYTYQNTWREEGAPSPAALISPTYMHDVHVAVTQDSFAGYRPFLAYKVYRTYGSNASYIETAMAGSGNILVDQSNAKSVVGKLLESADWTPPPDGLQGAALVSNGWFAAFKGNTLYMSEPYRPHAWPHSITFAKNIRGIAVAQQSIVVTTADGVHVVAGAFPASAQEIRLNSPQPGIAQRSMAAVDGAVAYASSDGIVFVEGTSATIEVSQKLFTRARWRERYGAVLADASLTFAYHDGCLVANSPTMAEGFTIRLDENVGAMSRIDGGYSAMFFLPVTDSLYYSVGNNVYQFRGGSNTAMDWWGKDWVFPSHATFGIGYIRCSQAMQVTLYADGAQVYTGSVSTGYFRLPSLPRALRWSVRVAGSGSVQELAFAQAMTELKGV